MRVTADEKLRIFYQHVPIDIAAGEQLDADFAVFLLERRAPVTPADDEAQAHLDALNGNAGQADDITAGADMPSPLAVPDGNIEQVLAWVGDDLERAVRALDVETAHKNRKSLIAALEKMFETPAPPGPDDNPPSGD